MSLKKTLSVFVGIPNLSTNDRYKSYLGFVSNALKNQKTSVKMLPTYITPPHAGTFEMGNSNRLDAIIGRMNDIVDKFMTSDASHLWILDGDVEPPPHALETLIRHNVDVASGVYPMHDFSTSNKMLFGEMKQGHQCGGFKPCLWESAKGQVFGETERWSGGTGCILIKRWVLKQHNPRLPALRFARTGLDKRTCGGDMFFWKRIQDAGFTARVDFNVACGHLPDYRLSRIDNWLHGVGEE